MSCAMAFEVPCGICVEILAKERGVQRSDILREYETYE
jgi:hypothetical protein